MKRKYFTIFLLFIFSISSSQDYDKAMMKDWQLKGYARSAERIGDSYTAIDYYNEYYSRNKMNNEISFKLAELYFEIKDYKNAKELFYKLYTSGEKKYYKSAFYYAKILKTEGNYISAIDYFERYKELVSKYNNGNELDLNYLIVLREIEGCELADEIRRNSNEIQIKHLNKTINNAHMESAPIILNDTTLVYSSLLIDTIPIVKVNDSKSAPVNRFYLAKLTDNTWLGGLSAPKPFFNFDSLHTSNGVFSHNKLRFYFTVSEENFEGKKISSIYVSNCKKGIWQEPKKLDNRINFKNFTCTQPAVGKCYNSDLDVIYFISDRPGGFGGFDIWYSVYNKVEGTYKTAMNAGSFINTPGNEITPFFDTDTKSLYFSSDGLAGMGGYDIYKSIGELVNWTPPENLGLPINSGYDDIYYSHTNEREHGFLVSNRSENTILKSPHCCYDIFEHNVTEDNLPEVIGIICESSTSLHDELREEQHLYSESNKKNASSNSIVELHIENENNGELIYIDSDTTNTEGKFSFNVEDNKNYQLSIYKNDFTPTKIMFNTNNVTNKLVTIDSIIIRPLDKKPIELENIYFEFNKWELSPESKKYIDTTLLVIMKNNKDIVIEISAHTDGIGNEDYNLMLSKNRAEIVVTYLTQIGIERSRIIAKGYGEAEPLEPETTDDGTDIPEARDKNRRIEFKVIGLVINDN